LSDQLLLIQRIAEELRLETSPGGRKAMAYGKYHRPAEEMPAVMDNPASELVLPAIALAEAM
jgi:hypothetical protein